MKRFIGLILAVFVFFTVIACAKKEAPYVAKVGNAKITQATLEQEIKKLPEFAQRIFEGEEGKERFLNELIKKELLYQEALKQGIDKDGDYQRRIKEFQERLNEFKKLTLIGLLLEKKIEPKSQITDADVKGYYEKHEEEFAPLNRVRLSHILVKTEDEAKNILERLRKGEDFAKIAKKSSIEPTSAKKGGDTGYLSRDQITPEIRAIAARLKKGEVSEPIKTELGYQIVKVTDKQTGKLMEFEKVKNSIMQRLVEERQKEAFDSYIEQLKKSYKVDINKEALSKLGIEKKEGITK
ncbi:MAG: peptidyl-prolyl cis-trans isomerase [Nitrospirota bacterium]